MRVTRIFVDGYLAEGKAFKLSGSAASHLSRVLRLEPGAELTLFNGQGGEYAATLTDLHGSTVTVRPHTHHKIERESPLTLTLIQSVARGEKMDWIVQKATELGVAQIIPVFTERTVVKLDTSQALKRTDHWRGVAVSACEQCGRNRLPEIVQPLTLETLLRELPEAKEKQRLLLDPTSETRIATLSSALLTSLLIGPEGGLSDREREQASQAGFKGVSLGPRILRTETAGLAAITLLQGKFGDI
jgi:16S rRNA (uracil1498-N3)-methyltransferase